MFPVVLRPERGTAGFRGCLRWLQLLVSKTGDGPFDTVAPRYRVGFPLAALRRGTRYIGISFAYRQRCRAARVGLWPYH